MTSSREPDLRAAAELPSRRARRRRAVRGTVGQATFLKVGLPAFHGFDLYRFAISLNTRRFLLLFLVAEFAINMVFAGLYMLVPGSIGNQAPPGFLGAFFFSLETLATVGYGEMFPGSLYGHVVAGVEILVGVGFTALMTGILFVRFSKPRAKVIYASRAVVMTLNAQPTLVFRIGNARADPLHNAEVTLHVLTRSVSVEGLRQAHPAELHLIRNRLPVFAITWNLMHVIDESSPLHGLDSGDAEFAAQRFFLKLDAHDPTIGQEISDLHSFSGADIFYGMRYVDAVTAIDDTTTIADFALLSDIEPEPPRA